MPCLLPYILSLSLSHSSKTLSISPISPSNTRLPTLLAVIAIDPFAATAFRLFSMNKSVSQSINGWIDQVERILGKNDVATLQSK
jgi:hypothetical protein